MSKSSYWNFYLWLISFKDDFEYPTVNEKSLVFSDIYEKIKISAYKCIRKSKYSHDENHISIQFISYSIIKLIDLELFM